MSVVVVHQNGHGAIHNSSCERCNNRRNIPCSSCSAFMNCPVTHQKARDPLLSRWMRLQPLDKE